MSTVFTPVPPVAIDPAGPSASTLKQTVWVAEHRSIHLPGWVKDLASFRRWTQSEQCPEKLRICYFQKELWVDLTLEQAFSHNGVKTATATILKQLVDAGRLGLFFSDGMSLSNTEVDLSTVPDSMLVTYSTIRAGRARLIEGKESGFIEVEGTPDMVLEVVSDSSEQKDTQTLRDLYWRAGIAEYWLIDARGEPLDFEILRHGSKGYSSRRKQGGWVKSAVFGKAFQLGLQPDELGYPLYTLAVK